MLKEKTTTLQSVRGTANGMDVRGDMVVGTQLWKRRKTLILENKETKVAELGTGRQANHEVCRKCGGTHRFASHKLKCFRCGKKGNMYWECKKDQLCFHYHQPGDFWSRYHTLGTEGVQVPTLIVS